MFLVVLHVGNFNLQTTHPTVEPNISQLTPPGTPQRNGVSEHRNRILLDMVQSMMPLTDLPLSFWGYALETAASR